MDASLDLYYVSTQSVSLEQRDVQATLQAAAQAGILARLPPTLVVADLLLLLPQTLLADPLKVPEEVLCTALTTHYLFSEGGHFEEVPHPEDLVRVGLLNRLPAHRVTPPVIEAFGRMFQLLIEGGLLATLDVALFAPHYPQIKKIIEGEKMLHPGAEKWLQKLAQHYIALQSQKARER